MANEFNYLAYHGIDDIIRQQQWQCFIQDILLGMRKCLLSPKIFTNLYTIMYILILDFQLGGGGGGGERNVYLHIGQIMQGSLSLTRGCGCGRKKKKLLY